MRILVAVLILVFLVAIILGVEALRHNAGSEGSVQGLPTAAPGGIPIYLDGKLMGAFSPPDLEQLESASFVDAEEGKTQEGWWLRDVILLHVKEEALSPGSRVVVASSSREESVELTWAEVLEPANNVMFDVSSRGTLKLASTLEQLATRDQWVQDVDSIEITSR
jgi:hypothetical protein